MRTYKNELRKGLDALPFSFEQKQSILPIEFFEPVKSAKYKAIQGSIYANFYLNEYLSARPLSELKRFHKAIAQYEKNHNLRKECSLDWELLVDTVEFQYFVRTQYADLETVASVCRDYEDTKKLILKAYKGTVFENDAKGQFNTMLNMYNEALKSYKDTAQKVNLTYEKLEGVMLEVLGSNWAKELAKHLDCSISTVHKWKNNRVPDYVYHELKTIIKNKIAKLDVLQHNL